MDFQHSERSQAIQDEVRRFLDEDVLPAEHTFEEQAADFRRAGLPFRTPAVMGELKDKARQRGLWNLFLPDSTYGAGLSVLDYAPIAELSGRALAIAPEAMNCAAPDTGNMELLAMFATPRAERSMAASVAGRRDPLVLLDDRARGSQQRRHQHLDPHRA